MSTPETPRSGAPASPVSKPSDAILKGFRTTLEQRWKEFDEATMKEARNHPLLWWASEDTITTKRNENEDFKKAKATFDEVRTILGSLENDTTLKNALKWPGRLSQTIQTLRIYLDKADKAKEHNTVLSQTLADLTSLKAEMTEDTEDRKTAEIAKVAVAASVAAVADSARLVPDFSNAMEGGAKEIISEASKEVAGIKKNPLKKIAEFFGISNESIVGDMKEALSEKKSGGFEGIFASIKIFFYGFLAKIMGIDIAKSLTPEEMKLAGIVPKVEKKKDAEQQTGKEQVKEAFNEATYKTVSAFLIKKAYYEPGKSSFSTGLDIQKSQEEKVRLARIAGHLTLPEIRKGSYTQITQRAIAMPGDIPTLVSILQKNEKMLDSILHGSMPDWKEKPLTQVFEAANLYGGFLFTFDTSVDTMKTNMADMDISKAIWNLNIFSKDSPLLKSSISSLQKKEQWGFTQKILEIGFGWSSGVGAKEFQTTNYLSFEKELTPEEKVFMQKFFEFSTKILSTMYGILDGDSKSSIKSMWDNPNTTPKLAEMMSLYVLTGGNTDIASMNLAQKTAITRAPLKFATERNDAKVLANLVPYYASIVIDGESLMPPDVREVLKMSFQEVQWSILEKIGAFVGMSATATWEFAANNPFYAAMIATAFLFGGWAVLIALLRAKIFVLWGTLVAALTAWMMPAAASTKR